MTDDAPGEDGSASSGAPRPTSRRIGRRPIGPETKRTSRRPSGGSDEAVVPGPSSADSPATGRPAAMRTSRMSRRTPAAAGELRRPATGTSIDPGIPAGIGAGIGGPGPVGADPGEGGSADDTPPFGRRRRGRVAVGLVAVLVVGTLIAALFVLPVRAWLGQRQALAQSQQQLDVIWAENKRLEKVYDELQTDAVVEQQARSQFGLIKPGEIPLSVLPAPPATALPKGWPYDQVQRILEVRSRAAAAAGR